MKKVFVFSRAHCGHRDDYNAVSLDAMRTAGIDPVLVDTIRSRHTIGQSIFFPMIEEDVSSFLISVLVGCFTHHPVVGLLFRPAECFQHRWVSFIKRVIFRALRPLSWVTVVTILPFSVDARFAKIADDWIYDPQMWDADLLAPGSGSKETLLQSQIRQAAAGRRIVVALGRQDRDKGFDFLCSIWSNSEELRRRYLFVAVGRVATASRHLAERFEAGGGVVVDRFVDNQEMWGLYEVADLIWGCYAPNYNQASGICGRAFQCGVPIIMRKDSYMAAAMRDLGHAILEVEFDKANAAAAQIIEWIAGQKARGTNNLVVREMSDRFTQVVISKYLSATG